MTFNFKTFTAETLTASDLNNQFSKVENKFGNIVNSDISAAARITSQKLLDRYSAHFHTVPFVAATAGGNYTFEAQATVGSMTEYRFYPELPGKRAFLVSVSVYVEGHSANSGSEGVVVITQNGTTLATLGNGSTTSFGTDTTQYIRAGSGSSAYSSTIATLATGDYLGIKLGVDTGSGSPTASQVMVTFSYKVELTS